MISKLTPIYIVPSIEECLPFWEETLKFEICLKVPHEGKLGFVILKQGNSEMMIQSQASLTTDLPAIVGKSVLLYSEVECLSDTVADIEKNLAGSKIIVPRRTTFYGAQEIWVQDAMGNVLGFAEYPKKTE